MLIIRTTAKVTIFAEIRTDGCGSVHFVVDVEHLEFGAAVKPMCAEADLLSQIDMLDSRMEIYAETLPGVPTGTFSSRIFSLDKRIYHHE